ncbi:MAG: aromatic amino acid ammonia-lyase [Chitinispirillales bacterium]|jgi:histidine ammonia-lyase|nr:aromatic amino acid ammonia-lyase [Chitinispirillales bacterium]
MKRYGVVLDGKSLSLDNVITLANTAAKVSLSDSALLVCAESRKIIEDAVNSRKIIYGVNTSYGPMCNKIIDDGELETLQVNLLRSHSAGMGNILPYNIARAVFAIRLNCLVKGYSGVRVELLRFMEEAFNEGVAPVIPEQGSVGASGDLIPLAHLGLGLIGEGDLYFQNETMPAKKALEKANLKPIKLSYKEALSIMNGTSVMSAIACISLQKAKNLFNVQVLAAAFAMEIFSVLDDAFDTDLHALKNHEGQVEVAKMIENLIAGSQNTVKRDGLHDKIRLQKKDGAVFETREKVQDVYSLRCTPQVLAVVYDAIKYAQKVLLTEINSSNDNPLVIPESGRILHGGNFHGQSVSFAMDSLRIAISTLCNISERRTNKLLDKNLNDGLPENLAAGHIGLDIGFMGSQYLAVSTAAENRQLACPMSVNTISSNESNQDVVSMGTVSARLALKSVENAELVQTMEILADLQAFSFRNDKGLGPKAKKIYDELVKNYVQYDCKQVFRENLLKFHKIIFEDVAGKLGYI